MKKHSLIVCIIIFSMPLVALGQLKHKVVLNNGTVFRGKLVESANVDVVLIQTLDGTLQACAMNEVQEIGKTSWKERHSFSLDRPLGVFLRPEFGLGSMHRKNYNSVIVNTWFGCSVNVSFGMQIGPYDAIYVGAGINQSFCYYYDRNCWATTDWLFVGNRLYFNPKRNSMFLDLRLGIGNVSEDYIGRYYTINYCVSYPTWFGSIGMGKSIGPIELGLYFTSSSYYHVYYDGYINYTYRTTTFCFTTAYNFRKSL